MASKKRFFGSHLQFSRWMGLSEIKSNARNIKSLFSSLGNFDTGAESETFEQAQTRLNLTEEDIVNRTMYFLRLALVYLFCAICMIVYATYLYFTKDYMGSFMCLPILSVILSFAFREHFWYTQMKHRKLGMTGKDWFDSLIKGGSQQ